MYIEYAKLITLLWMLKIYNEWPLIRCVQKVLWFFLNGMYHFCNFQLGLSTDWVCAQPELNPNDSSGWKNDSKPTQMIWLDFSVWVSRFQVVSGQSRVLSPGPIFGQILRDLAKIWPNLLRSGQNLAGSVEIWLRFRRIMARSHRIWSIMLNI